MDRLFLDANVLFSAAYSKDAGVRRLWRLSDVELITSGYAAEEARRNLEPDQRVELEVLLRNVSVLDVAAPEQTTKPHRGRAAPDLPEKDRPILLAAIGVGATHLITGDFTHFGPYFGGVFGNVLITTPAAYLAGRSNRRA